jgi:flagellar motility protein MotE (MotC chaperone)
MKLSHLRSAHRPTAPANRPKPRRRGLFLLALLLSVSGVLRLGEGIAQTVTEDPAPHLQTEGATAEPQSCPTDEGAMALLETLQAREARLREQEARAATEEQTLAVARETTEARIAALVAAEEKLAATVAIADQAAEKDITRLVAVYESMKPKDAAKLFGEMEPDFAAGFLARMRPEAAATVMSGLDPAKAYAISIVLAGRNANAPKS